MVVVVFGVTCVVVVVFVYSFLGDVYNKGSPKGTLKYYGSSVKYVVIFSRQGSILVLLIMDRPRNQSKRVTMPNLLEVYCILIDAQQCFLYSIIYATTNTPLVLCQPEIWSPYHISIDLFLVIILHQ